MITSYEKLDEWYTPMGRPVLCVHFRRKGQYGASYLDARYLSSVATTSVAAESCILSTQALCTRRYEICQRVRGLAAAGVLLA